MLSDFVVQQIKFANDCEYIAQRVWFMPRGSNYSEPKSFDVDRSVWSLFDTST